MCELNMKPLTPAEEQELLWILQRHSNQTPEEVEAEFASAVYPDDPEPLPDIDVVAVLSNN